MLVFSAHGGGYTGFGGDDNVGRRRRLSNSNIDIANAIDDALVAASVPGIKLDVLGFDACLMCSYAALAEYQYLTTYYGRAIGQAPDPLEQLFEQTAQ
jgi:hypothetical protein